LKGALVYPAGIACALLVAPSGVAAVGDLTPGSDVALWMGRGIWKRILETNPDETLRPPLS
jgi:hypothetical protein